MTTEKIGRNTKASWIALRRVFYCLCFIIWGYGVFESQFYLERAEILGARKALAGKKLDPADLVAPPIPDTNSKDGGFEAWERELAARSIPVVAVKWVFLSILAGAVAAGCGWLLIAGMMFGWWFLLDRVKDLSQAIRGETGPPNTGISEQRPH